MPLPFERGITMAKKIIVLDAGHGLLTGGKQTPDGIKEWLLNDKVRDKVVDLLEDYDVEFIFTDNNEGQKDESLASRVAMYIGEKEIAAVVSIHHNAYKGVWGNHTGTEVWTDRNPTTKDLHLADCIYGRLVKYSGLNGRGIFEENWYIINQDKFPAVLVECGFMDSLVDYPIITSSEGQQNFARAIAEGLIEFCDLKKKTTTASTKKEMYRVRKTWADAASQKGAFSVLMNAKKCAEDNPGYKVFNSAGKAVYTPASANYYDKYTGTADQIDTVLKAIGVPAGYRGAWNKRKPVATANGITGYSGTAEQNYKMIELAKKGKLKKV